MTQHQGFKDTPHLKMYASNKLYYNEMQIFTSHPQQTVFNFSIVNPSLLINNHQQNKLYLPIIVDGMQITYNNKNNLSSTPLSTKIGLIWRIGGRNPTSSSSKLFSTLYISFSINRITWMKLRCQFVLASQVHVSLE